MPQSLYTCCVGRRTKGSDKGKEEIKSVCKTRSRDDIKFYDKMVKISGSEFLMGTEDNEGFLSDGEGPIRKVKVNSILVDSTAVTNEEFRHFIDDTGYITDAEKYGWSFVFHLFVCEKTRNKSISLTNEPTWWLMVEGATWCHPEGPNSDIRSRLKHPVTHISWNDALAFCEWAGKRLPTDSEWEYAARGGLEQKKYPWGDTLTPNGEHYCNIWQGEFPNVNKAEDGYVQTAPAKSFPPNGYGLYNMAGNVWEWCSDWFTADLEHRGGYLNPQGPEDGQTKVIRGGSYLCHHSYCNRYRVAARTHNTPDTSAGNIGFRCVKGV